MSSAHSSPGPLESRRVTRIFRTLSDETRFRLLRLLWREELSVNELSQITQLAQPRISNHLKILREEGLLSERRQGSWRHYRVHLVELDETVRSLWPTLEAAWKDDDHFEADDKRLSDVLAARTREQRGTFFDELAEQWDDIRASLFGDALGREILRAFLPEDLVVADIGTGTGYVLQLFGQRARKLIAIDNSQAMLDLAQEKARANGLENVEFRLADAEDTPLHEGEADVITMVQVLHHFQQPAEVLKNAARGLAPRGRLILNDFLDHDEAWLREELQHRWSGFPRARIVDYLSQAGLEMVAFDILAGRTYISPEGHRLKIPDGFTAVGRRA